MPRAQAAPLCVFIHDSIRAQAQRRPDAIALQDERGVRYSYARLEQFSSQWAQRLRRHGVGPEVKVGLCMARSCDMIVAALAILKAGGAYVSLDPSYPMEGLRKQVHDAQLQLILVDDAQPVAAELGAPQCLHWTAEDVSSECSSAPDVALSCDNLAYVVYTSGSTGQPKGVGVSHRALMQHVSAIVSDYGLSPEDCAMQFASLSFDASVEQWAGPLCAGARLFIRGDELWTPEQALRVLRDQAVTWFEMPPGLLLELARAALARGERIPVRACTAGGEAIARESLQTILRAIAPAPLINAYGPTEAVISPMTWHASDAAQCTTPYALIGRTVGARRAYESSMSVVASRAVTFIARDLRPSASCQIRMRRSRARACTARVIWLASRQTAM
jgi:non-ribosomal peptide synthetase component F